MPPSSQQRSDAAHGDGVPGKTRPKEDEPVDFRTATIEGLVNHQPPLSLPEVCRRVHLRVAAFLEDEVDGRDATAAADLGRVRKQTRNSLEIIADALQQYRADQLSLSYNGGKDCLVLLILYLSALHTHHSASPDPPPWPRSLQAVYIRPHDPFPPLEVFVRATSDTYSLSLSTHTHPSMRAAFAAHLTLRPHIAAILVGTRRTDPHGADLVAAQPTDHGWPAFMRIHPVLEWAYADVWALLHALGVSYCELYDKGYTSLGGTGDTGPNPALKREDGEGYLPAWELKDERLERMGRGRGETR